MRWRDDGDRSLGHRPPHGLLFHGPEMAGKGATVGRRSRADGINPAPGQSSPPKTNFWSFSRTRKDQKWPGVDKNRPKTWKLSRRENGVVKDQSYTWETMATQDNTSELRCLKLICLIWSQIVLATVAQDGDLCVLLWSESYIYST